MFRRKPFKRPRTASRRRARAGFTLIEALVALAVCAVCLSAIGFLMAKNNRSVLHIEQRLALVSTLRKVEAALPDRSSLAGASFSGEMGDNGWAVSATPYPDPSPPPASKDPPAWSPQLVVMRAQAPSGGLVEVQTLRLVPRPAQ